FDRTSPDYAPRFLGAPCLECVMRGILARGVERVKQRQADSSGSCPLAVVQLTSALSPPNYWASFAVKLIVIVTPSLTVSMPAILGGSMPKSFIRIWVLALPVIVSPTSLPVTSNVAGRVTL